MTPTPAKSQLGYRWQDSTDALQKLADAVAIERLKTMERYEYTDGVEVQDYGWPHGPRAIYTGDHEVRVYRGCFKVESFSKKLTAAINCACDAIEALERGEYPTSLFMQSVEAFVTGVVQSSDHMYRGDWTKP
jgi:hypothetical protein